MPSLGQDIRPLSATKTFRSGSWFDLSQYDEAKTHAHAIYDRLVDGSLPCDGAWAEDRIALFRQWMEEGNVP